MLCYNFLKFGLRYSFMSFLSQYGWIISAIGLCLNIAILFFCRNKNPLSHLEKIFTRLLSNDNVCSLFTQLFCKSNLDKDLTDNLSQLIDYIKSEKK